MLDSSSMLSAEFSLLLTAYLVCDFIGVGGVSRSAEIMVAASSELC